MGLRVFCIKNIAFLFFFSLAAGLLSPSAAADPVRVVIEGLEGDALKNARAALALPPGIIREGSVDKTLLGLFERRVPEKIRQALEPFGYYDPQVSTALEQENGGYVLRVKTNPGDPVRVGVVNVRVTGMGAKERDFEKLVSSFPLKTGEVLNQVRYENAKEGLRTRALNLGYLGAEYTRHVIRLSLAERKADIDLELQTGPRYRYGEVTWEGTQLYPRSFLERFLDFKPGEPYSYSKTYQTQVNLINSDRFSSVTVREDKEEAQDLRVPVRIHLEASPPKRLRPGIGYATDTGARLSLRYQDMNMFHRGHELNTDLSIGERLSGMSATYAIPRAGHVDNRTLFKTAFQQEVLKPYNSQLFTLEGEQARSFGSGIVGSAYVQFRHETFSEPAQEGKSSLIVPGLRLYQRRVDDLVRPRKGFRYTLETRGSTDSLGAETNFLQFLGTGDAMIPLPWKLTFLPRLQVGATWETDPLTDLPPTLRFYAGGDRSVRGYTYQSLGPKDSSGNVIGGKNLLVASVELEYALTRTWGLAAFYDAGNAFNNLPDLQWAQGAGLGIRYYTPAGPIRLDIARQINVLHPGFQFHISVGFVL